MKQYNLDGVNDQRKWDVLQRNFDFERHRIDETARKADSLASTLYPRQLQFMEECVAETIRLGRLLVPVIVSVRKELELPIDEAEYRKVAEEAVARQVESLREFMQKVQSLIAAQPSVAPGGNSRLRRLLPPGELKRWASGSTRDRNPILTCEQRDGRSAGLVASV